MAPSPERWEQMRPLLDAAWDLPAAERPAYLARACAGRPTLHRAVATFLEAEARAPAFLDRQATTYATALLSAFAGETPDEGRLKAGQRLGAYRIVETIGRGGMSIVYRARRADGQFEQEVAVKVLGRHTGAGNFTRRFLAERQILASFRHPNIVQVFDGGVLEGGRPYLVMEYVDGLPITTYCAEKRLALEERLALFTAVAEAVQHAHRNMVVHRDLKPSNILVKEEGEGRAEPAPDSIRGHAVPLLLDFGIAKVLDEAAAPQQAPLTRTGMHLMTPEYAAPEQIKGEVASAATDVYALGALLYELLTGRSPYRLDRRTPYEIMRAVCEETPRRPSLVVAEQRDEAPRAEERPHRLHGDLDAIALRALQKEPERRYETVEALAEDVCAFRSGRPVRARPDTWRYRTGKFVRRHRSGVAMTAAFLALILAFAALYTERVADVRDRARIEVAQAEAAAAFLTDFLRQTNPPPGTTGGAPAARDALRRGLARASALDHRPAVQAELMTAIGEGYASLGLYPSAELLLRMALRMRTERLGPAHPEVIETEYRLAYLLLREGRYAEAEPVLLKSYRSFHTAFGPEDRRTLAARAMLAALYTRWGRPERAAAFSGLEE